MLQWPAEGFACPLSRSSVQNVPSLRKSPARFRPAVPTTSASTVGPPSRSDRPRTGCLTTCRHRAKRSHAPATCLCLATQSHAPATCRCLATQSHVPGTCLCLATQSHVPGIYRYRATPSRVPGTCRYRATRFRDPGTCRCRVMHSRVLTISLNPRAIHDRAGCPVRKGLPARRLRWGWRSTCRWRHIPPPPAADRRSP